MGYRVQTANAHFIHVRPETIEGVDEKYGYEYSYEDGSTKVVVLDDLANQEALVLTGSPDELFDLAMRILNVVAKEIK